MGRIFVVLHLLVQSVDQRVQEARAVVLGLAAHRAANACMAASAWVSGVSRRNRLGGKRSTASRTTPAVSWVSTAPSTSTVSSLERAVGRECVGDIAEGVFLLVEPAVGGHVDAASP